MVKTLVEHPRVRQPVELVVEILTNEQVVLFWPAMRRELSRIPEHWDELWTIESLQQSVEMGIFKVWAIGPRLGPDHIQYNLIAFTQELEFPANKVLRVVLMFGNGMTKDHLDILDASFERHCRVRGIGLIDGMVRSGWLKALRERGVKPRGIYLTKRVNQEWQQ